MSRSHSKTARLRLSLTNADTLRDGKSNMAKGLSFPLSLPLDSTPSHKLNRFDHEERTRKRIARESHKQSESAQKLTGLRAKLYQKKRHAEKIQMKKQIRAHEQRNVKSSAPPEPSSTPLPQYLLDRTQPTSAKALSTAIKNKRAEKAAKFSVPLPKVRGIAEEEMFKVVKTGKKIAKKGWKRMITKPTFGTFVVSRNTLLELLHPRSYLETPPLFLSPQPKTDEPLTPNPNLKTPTDFKLFASWTRFHSTPRKIRALYTANGSPLQKGQRDAPRARCNGAASHHQCQEEPSEPDVYPTGCINKRNHYRSKCQRIRLGDSGWEGGVGKMGADKFVPSSLNAKHGHQIIIVYSQ